LKSIFDDKPKVFQSLCFWQGSEQAIHKDAAYVKVDTGPLRLAATWLALEDITPGTGELEFYIGSHRAPDYLFGGVHKWMENLPEEHHRFLQSLYDDAEKYSQRHGSFLAKQGDVLIWHADLAHGGSQITQPDKTRKSLVAHFTSAADEPFYRRQSCNKQLEAETCCFVSRYLDVNELAEP
jgi:ectoine hydroxylase-related dioxygenase (phytanoyl-CoA dioxygenase family)